MNPGWAEGAGDQEQQEFLPPPWALAHLPGNFSHSLCHLLLWENVLDFFLEATHPLPPISPYYPAVLVNEFSFQVPERYTFLLFKGVFYVLLEQKQSDLGTIQGC